MICQECKVNYFLFEEFCIEVCPSGYWGDLSDRKCKPCHSTCKECSKAGAESCTVCDNPLYLHLG
jgi:proprotein convertase subtilisin/kexin type 5